MDQFFLQLIYSHGRDGLVVYVLLTTLVAALLSFCIGLERQLRGEAAGVRTHALLAAGASLLMTLSIWAIRIADGSMDPNTGMTLTSLEYDTSRIAAAVVTGIGFLGGGVIVKERFAVKGLCTASTLWICVAIGMACGSGFVLEAIIFTVVTLLILIAFGKILDLIDLKSPSVTITAQADYPIMERVRDLCDRNGLDLKTIHILGSTDKAVTARISFIFRTDRKSLKYFCRQMSLNPEIIDIVEND